MGQSERALRSCRIAQLIKVAINIVALIDYLRKKSRPMAACAIRHFDMKPLALLL